MNRKRNAALIGLALFAAILAAYLLYGNLSSKNKMQKNTAVPSQAAASSAADSTSSARTASQDFMQAADFTVYDASGKAVKLSDFRGKPVVLNFWSSWSESCKQELPYFSEEYKKEKGNVQFLMVDYFGGDDGNETQKTAAEFLKKQNYGFPVFYDQKQDAQAHYSFADVPDTYFIDRKGRLIAICEGTIEKSALERSIAAIKSY